MPACSDGGNIPGKTCSLGVVVGDCGRFDTYWNLGRGPIAGPNVRPRAVYVPEVPRPTQPLDVEFNAPTLFQGNDSVYTLLSQN
jgi:hypothetical protein